MVRKKQPIRPLVAKPLNDSEKRNLVTSFVTNNITENKENAEKIVTDNKATNVTDNVTEINNNNDTLEVTNKDTS